MEGTISDRIKDIMNNPKELSLYVDYMIASEDEKKNYLFTLKSNGRLTISYIKNKQGTPVYSLNS